MKSKIIKSIVCFISALGFLSTNVSASPEIGEEAYFKVDTNRRRTSWMIQSGEALTKVVEFHPETDIGPAYEVRFDFNFKVRGREPSKDTFIQKVEEEVFTEAFLERLRENGSYEGSSFTVIHKGYATAKTMDGHNYGRCDKVFVKDIKLDSKHPFVIFLKSLAQQSASQKKPNGLEKIEAEALVKWGQPVFGAVKIDMDILYKGIWTKVGADYMAM